MVQNDFDGINLAKRLKLFLHLFFCRLEREAPYKDVHAFPFRMMPSELGPTDRPQRWGKRLTGDSHNEAL
jgi:hypothetical protein